nr:hypothetical protein [uncultured Lichenicoccus sp.]
MKSRSRCATASTSASATPSAGGLIYGMCTVPEILACCRDIREVAEPGAWFLNYAIPMAMNSWAAIEHGGVADTVDLC